MLFGAQCPIALYSGVPGVAAFGSGGAEALAEVLHRVSDGYVVYELDALVAELARRAQAQRAAEADRKIAVIHAPGDECARMEGFSEVNAVPPVRLNGEVGEEASFGLEASFTEDRGEWCADPLGDVRPAFLACNLGYLAACGEGAEIRHGE